LTSGSLYIGGGSATASHTNGPIIIGADSTATGGINIGTKTDLTVPTENTINIGSASYTTNIKGTQTNTGLITANGGVKSSLLDVLTSGGGLEIAPSQLGGAILIGINKTADFIALGNPSNSGQSVILNAPAAFNQGITLNNTGSIKTTTITYTAPNNAIGYQSSGSGSTIASLTTTISSACITISNIQIGFYIITLSGNITGFSATTNAATPTITGTNATINMTKYNVGSTTFTSGFSYSGPVQITSSTNSITLQFTMSAGTANMAVAPTYSYIRIA
jgi:hypothetical protein